MLKLCPVFTDILNIFVKHTYKNKFPAMPVAIATKKLLKKKINSK